MLYLTKVFYYGNNFIHQKCNSTHTPRVKWQLSLVIICLMFISSFTSAQQAQTHYYYIEEASYDLLKPTNVIENEAKTLSLEFEDESLTSFFQDFTIHSYVREFEFSRFKSLHKYYLIELNSEYSESELLLNNKIVSAEYAGPKSYLYDVLLNTPNDYFVDNLINIDWLPDGSFDADGDLQNAFSHTDIREHEHLELINARRAWNISTGNSNIIIGILDIWFNTLHPELNNGKVTATYGTMSTTIGNHGLSVAGVAAGNTGNGQGFSSIGYNSSLALSTGQTNVTTIPPGLLAGGCLYMAEDNSNIKVINVSQGRPYLGPITAQAEAFQHIKDSLNVTVVLAAGNGIDTGGNITE